MKCIGNTDNEDEICNDKAEYIYDGFSYCEKHFKIHKDRGLVR